MRVHLQHHLQKYLYHHVIYIMLKLVKKKKKKKNQKHIEKFATGLERIKFKPWPHHLPPSRCLSRQHSTTCKSACIIMSHIMLKISTQTWFDPLLDLHLTFSLSILKTIMDRLELAYFYNGPNGQEGQK
ncbi:hypothetical protein HanRHA438_Chr02g0085131 [Helianthus annuus]|nr:hypothetical protein HanRHA438_Chr02g0085131 [Helianthus annuus]